MKVRELMEILGNLDADIDVYVESHCGVVNRCIGVDETSDCIILRNEDQG